jgi:hypothetical protein
MSSDPVARPAPASAPLKPASPARRRRLPALSGANALLIAGTLLIAIYTVSVAAEVSGWALDETLVKQSALHYRHGLPGTLFHDLNARATSRLLPLLLMPIFALWDGDTGLRIARAACALLFCSASIPVVLLARTIVRSRWLAAAAGLLSIAAPWLTLGTTIYTENLAYPLFAWALLAMSWAARRGGWAADLVVIGAIGLCTTARVQMFVLLPAWLIANWVLAFGRRERHPGGGRRQALLAFGRAFRAAPVSHAILGLIVFVALVRWRMGHLHADVRQLLGPYSELQDRGHVSSDVFPAVAIEFEAVVLPALAAAAAAIGWFTGALREPRRESWTFAVIAVTAVTVLWFVTAYIQGGYLGDATEERYYFYAFPLVWIGAFAALEDPVAQRRRFVAAAAALVALIGINVLPRELDAQSAFLTPATACVHHIANRVLASLSISGLTMRDALAVVAIVLLVPSAFAWRSSHRVRVVTLALVPALLQLGLTGYAFAAREGKVPGVEGQTGGLIGLNAWVDRHAGGNDVTWLNNQPYGIDPSADGWQYQTLLWNSRIRGWAQDATSGLIAPAATLAALPVRQVSYDAASGLVHGLERAGPFVSYIHSPFFRIAGQRIAQGPGNGLELIAPHEPVQAIWRAGPMEIDGSINPAVPFPIDAWRAPGAPRGRLVVELDMSGPATGPASVDVRLGDVHKVVALAPNAAKKVVLDVCPRGVHAAGRIRGLSKVVLPDGRNSSGRIDHVKVTPKQGGC